MFLYQTQVEPNEELAQAYRDRILLTKFEVWDYSIEPPTVTTYCGLHSPHASKTG